MISASAVLWLTAVCPFDATAIGANVRSPTNAKHNPVVGLEGFASPTKSESANNNNLSSCMGSQLLLTKLAFTLEYMSQASRNK